MWTESFGLRQTPSGATANGAAKAEVAPSTVAAASRVDRRRGMTLPVLKYRRFNTDLVTKTRRYRSGLCQAASDTPRRGPIFFSTEEKLITGSSPLVIRPRTNTILRPA